MRVGREGGRARTEPGRAAWSCLRLAAVALLLPAAAFCQAQASEASVSPHDLVRAMVSHELQPLDSSQCRWMYRKEREVEGRKIVKEVVETPQGSLFRVIGQDGHALSAQER